MRKLLRSSISSLTAAALAFGSLPARANPLGGQVVAGSATISGTGTSQFTINQSSVKAIIDWRSFNIAKGETTTFVQPTSGSVTLNRVTGALGLSTINGIINANGGVYVVNPDGILFGPNAKINVGSFLGTTHDIANSDFMAGNYNFTISGNPSASIVNQGSITAANGGFAALVAPGVRNDGIINARLGTVALASGNAFTLDLYGDNLIKLQPGDAIANDVRDAATGQTMTSLVQNTGTLKANGGTVSMTAVTARKVLDSVINSSGTVEADSVGTKNGLVLFGAQTADTKLPGAPTQNVKVSGTVKAAGKKPNTTGGKIQVTGENIQLASAKLDASGQVGGGKILIGGDWKGGDPTAPAVTLFGQSFETTPVPTAAQVTVDAYSVLNASAIKTGNGGKVVVWADGNTKFAGSLLAYGGIIAGNGGFAEVSGKQTVTFAGIRANLSAPKGKAGTILFDPDVENIDQTAGDAIAALLNGTAPSTPVDGNIVSPVEINSVPAVVVTADTINVLANVNILKTSSGDSTLGLFATNGINIGPNVTIGSSGGKLNLFMDADSNNGAAFTSSFYQFTAGNPQDATIGTIALGVNVAILQQSYNNGVLTRITPPDLSDRSVVEVGQSITSQIPSGELLDNFNNAMSKLSSTSATATITIDPSTRFYLNGGSFVGYGNAYTFGTANYIYDILPYYSINVVPQQIDPRVVASYGGVKLSELSPGACDCASYIFSDGIHNQTYIAGLSYDVNRVRYQAPAGIVSSLPLPISVLANSQYQQPYTFSNFDVVVDSEKQYVLALYDDLFVGPLSSLWSGAKFIANNALNSDDPEVAEQDRQLVAVIQYFRNHPSELEANVLAALETTWAQAKNGDPNAVAHLASIIPSLVGPGVVVKALKEAGIASGVADVAVNATKSIQAATGPIVAVPDKTVTIIGSYIAEGGTKSILSDLKNPITSDFGPNKGGFNLLNVPAEVFSAAKKAGTEWETINKPWLDAAISRGDVIAVATKPEGSALLKPDGSLTSFGKEIVELKKNGYVYDPSTSTMIKSK